MAIRKKKTTRELYSMFSGAHTGMSIEDFVCSTFTLTEESYGIATTMFGVCKKKRRAHSFEISAETVTPNILN